MAFFVSGSWLANFWVHMRFYHNCVHSSYRSIDLLRDSCRLQKFWRLGWRRECERHVFCALWTPVDSLLLIAWRCAHSSDQIAARSGFFSHTLRRDVTITSRSVSAARKPSKPNGKEWVTWQWNRFRTRWRVKCAVYPLICISSIMLSLVASYHFSSFSSLSRSTS